MQQATKIIAPKLVTLLCIKGNYFEKEIRTIISLQKTCKHSQPANKPTQHRKLKTSIIKIADTDKEVGEDARGGKDIRIHGSKLML